MKVVVTSRSGRELIKGGLELSDSATVTDLQEEIHIRSMSGAFKVGNRKLRMNQGCMYKAISNLVGASGG